MNTQPEALRLADALEPTWTLQSDKMKAASELRHLHEVNQMLVESAEMALEALEFDASNQPGSIWGRQREALHQALSKAKEQT